MRPRLDGNQKCTSRFYLGSPQDFVSVFFLTLAPKLASSVSISSFDARSQAVSPSLFLTFTLAPAWTSNRTLSKKSPRSCRPHFIVVAKLIQLQYRHYIFLFAHLAFNQFSSHLFVPKFVIKGKRISHPDVSLYGDKL